MLSPVASIRLWLALLPGAWLWLSPIVRVVVHWRVGIVLVGVRGIVVGLGIVGPCVEVIEGRVIDSVHIV